MNRLGEAASGERVVEHRRVVPEDVVGNEVAGHAIVDVGVGLDGERIRVDGVEEIAERPRVGLFELVDVGVELLGECRIAPVRSKPVRSSRVRSSRVRLTRR